MAPVIWGLDLAEITWSKFGGKNMWNPDYHLRRTKFVVYQLAMILTVTSESLGTAALSDYIDGQQFIKRMNNNAIEYNDDFVGIGSYNIFVGVYIAFIFGGAYFFDLIWPARREDRGIRIAWKCCALAASIFILGDIIGMTYIVSSKRAYVTGVGHEEAERLLRAYGGYALEYKKNGRALASLIFLWLGFPATIASTIILWMSYDHDEKYGPYATHVREQMAQNGTSEKQLGTDETQANGHRMSTMQTTASSSPPRLPDPVASPTRGAYGSNPGDAVSAAQAAQSQRGMRPQV